MAGSKLTFEEIIDFCISQDIDIEAFAEGDFSNPEVLGTIQYDLEMTGGEDEGTHWSTVHYFVDHNVYIRVTGHYESYHGLDFYETLKENAHEVFPYQTVATSFGSKKFAEEQESKLEAIKQQAVQDYINKSKLILG